MDFFILQPFFLFLKTRSLLLALAIVFVSSTQLLNGMRRSHAHWVELFLQPLGRKARQESGFKASKTYLCRETL